MEETKQRKRKRSWETAAKNKELKRIKKAEKEKEDKKELWCRLKELNGNFAKIKEQKKWNNKKKKIHLYSQYLFLILVCCK